MTDLEITKLCAEAMGWTGRIAVHEYGDHFGVFMPLHDDAQAMALVKKFGLTLYGPRRDSDWRVGTPATTAIENKDLNRAICECVAKMEKAKA